MIMNIPEYANKYEFIVTTKADNDYWFYGAYANENRAYAAAAEIGGEVFYNGDFLE